MASGRSAYGLVDTAHFRYTSFMAMPFSDTTTKNGLIQHVEFLAGLQDTDISGNATLLKQVTANLNRYQQKAVTVILNAQDEWDFDDPNQTDFPIATTPMVAGQRDYSFPASLKILKIKRVDATYDGTNYYEANPIDSKQIPYGVGNDTLLDTHYSINFPRYDMIGNSLRLIPEATSAQVSAGGLIRIEFLREAIDFVSTDTTKVPALDTPFQPYISTGAAFEYCLRNDLVSKANGLAQVLSAMEEQMKVYYGTKQLDREYRLQGYPTNYD